MWGSLLAGGDVIVSKGRNDPTVTNATVTEEDEIFLKAALPNWLYIDTRNVNNITVLSVDPKSKHFIKSDQNTTKISCLIAITPLHSSAVALGTCLLFIERML